jgi:hypothetical protein
MWPCDEQVRQADDHVSADMHETDKTTTVVETTTEQTEDLNDVNDREIPTMAANVTTETKVLAVSCSIP